MLQNKLLPFFQAIFEPSAVSFLLIFADDLIFFLEKIIFASML